LADDLKPFVNPVAPDNSANFEAERRRNCLDLGIDRAICEQAIDRVANSSDGYLRRSSRRHAVRPALRHSVRQDRRT
jgi:hypothetical protein